MEHKCDECQQLVSNLYGLKELSLCADCYWTRSNQRLAKAEAVIAATRGWVLVPGHTNHIMITASDKNCEACKINNMFAAYDAASPQDTKERGGDK